MGQASERLILTSLLLPSKVTHMRHRWMRDVCLHCKALKLSRKGVDIAWISLNGIQRPTESESC